MLEAGSGERIYLDHNATTPLREEVVEAMIRVLRDGYGNPSSTHTEGAGAKRAVDQAREQVASCVGAQSRDVVFTAGASEANNTVLMNFRGPGQIITSAVEHPSVVAPLAFLEANGVPVVRLAVDADGLLDLAELEDALTRDSQLVSLIWANNETGVIQPMEQIASLVHARGIPLHVDATQAIGKAPVDLGTVPAEFLSSSAHKLNGPKGVGCLIRSGGYACESLIRGGPQERGFRGGTENVASIVGYGVACELAAKEQFERVPLYRSLRDRLWRGIEANIPDIRRNGRADAVLVNTLNVEFCETQGEILLQSLDLEGVAASAGAACHSGSITPSHVLTAMGRSPDEARGCLRLSVGHGVDDRQIDRVIALLTRLVAKIRAAGPL